MGGQYFLMEPEKIVRKKGSCNRCFKGNWFTKKEACIVCTAKYCRNCVLRAMGPMPEGRKCVSCIGFPITESRRGSLRKRSPLLTQLLAESALKQIMNDEMVCRANQLPPELVRVNGKPLCQAEMLQLQNCPNPPKKLKAGNYWYDKCSGLWGKEGQKPCQIITPLLNVGDPLLRDASNGNTAIFINNREITKAEVWMLKSAGVHCVGKTSFWVTADGLYQEEGQKKVRGPIWEKTPTKILCAILSLPIPPESANYSEEGVKTPINGVLQPSYLEQGTLNEQPLLAGYNQ